MSIPSVQLAPHPTLLSSGPHDRSIDSNTSNHTNTTHPHPHPQVTFTLPPNLGWYKIAATIVTVLLLFKVVQIASKKILMRPTLSD
jgi:hypothetical protein